MNTRSLCASSLTYVMIINKLLQHYQFTNKEHKNNVDKVRVSLSNKLSNLHVAIVNILYSININGAFSH